MFELILLYLSALTVGLVLCAMPDAVNTEALRRGVKGGFRPSFLILLGSCIGDLLWVGTAIIGLAFLVQNRYLNVALGLLGSAIVFYMANGAFNDARSKKATEPDKRVEGRSFLAGALISLCNPLEIMFWLGIGGTFISALVPNPVEVDYAIFLFGYMTGSFLWCFIFAGLAAYCRKFLNPRLYKTIHIFCGLVMVFFGVAMLWSSLTW